MNAIGVIEGPQGAAAHWSTIDWTRVRHHVSRLQARIVKAVRAGKWHRVRCLQRLLGIPTQADRAEQALELLALDPVSETLADVCSHGFRKERSTQDAMAACFLVLCQRQSAEWILEGDIRGCFDHLDQDWLVDRLPTNKGKLRAWLKAGYLERQVFHPTVAGTPQGGISPTAANMALARTVL